GIVLSVSLECLERHADAEREAGEVVADEIAPHQARTLERQPGDLPGIELEAGTKAYQERAANGVGLVTQERASGRLADTAYWAAEGLPAGWNTQARPQAKRHEIGLSLGDFRSPAEGLQAD